MILPVSTGCRVSCVVLSSLGSLLLATRSPAQTGTTADTATRSRVEREMIAIAEAEGATHLRSTLGWTPPGSFANAAGTADRKCVEPRANPTRSGEFVIGGQIPDSPMPLRAGVTGKIWWAPLYYAPSMTLFVSAYSITNPGQSFTFTSSNVAFGATQGVSEREYFFPSGFTVPQPGRWLIVATNKVNWGCFILTVK
jgi:hypothetical protein